MTVALGEPVVLDHRELECFPYDPAGKGGPKKPGEGKKVPLLDQPRWGHIWLVEKFVNWLDGGEPMETNVEDTLQSVALFEAAILSSKTNQPVRVQDYLSRKKEGSG